MTLGNIVDSVLKNIDYKYFYYFCLVLCDYFKNLFIYLFLCVYVTVE